jgi:hypothetical protein
VKYPWLKLPTLRSSRDEALNMSTRLKETVGPDFSLLEIPQEFPGWRDDDCGFLPSLPCVAWNLVQPTAPIEAAVHATLNHTAHSVAMHVRTSDADMVGHMSAKDDWEAWIAKTLAHSAFIRGITGFAGRRLQQPLAALPSVAPPFAPADERRRLVLAFGLFHTQKAGCDKDAGNLELLPSCAQRVAQASGWRAVTMFEASDSSQTDAWFKGRVSGLVQAEGVPVHTGREVDAQSKASLAKAYIDFFVLARATALVSNCNGESTFVGAAKLLRDGAPTHRNLHSYRAVDCARLAPFPANTHVEWKRDGMTMREYVHARPGNVLAAELIGVPTFIICLLVLCCRHGSKVLRRREAGPECEELRSF